MKILLLQFVGIGSLAVSLPSCKINEEGRGKPLTHRAMINLARGIRQGLWENEKLGHFEKMTPKELFDYMDSVGLIYYDSWLGKKEARDIWGNPFKISIRENDFTIESPGKDKK